MPARLHPPSPCSLVDTVASDGSIDFFGMYPVEIHGNHDLEDIDAEDNVPLTGYRILTYLDPVGPNFAPDLVYMSPLAAGAVADLFRN